MAEIITTETLGLRELRALVGRDDIDVFSAQLLKRPVSASALEDAVTL